MRWHRIHSVMLHAWHHMLHSRETWVDIGWFPLINLLVVGGFAAYMASLSTVGNAQFTTIAIVLWYTIEIGSYSVIMGALWEIWAKSFSSLFITPLTIEEFIVGHILFSIFKHILLIILLSIVSFAVFDITPFSLGLMLPIYVILLGIYGSAFGMFVLGLLLRFGTGLQSLAWGLIFILQPIIGIFYPIEILPYPIQLASRLIAPTYVFTSARFQLQNGSPQWNNIAIAFALDIVALALGYAFVKYMWNTARRTGTLARMEE